MGKIKHEIERKIDMADREKEQSKKADEQETAAEENEGTVKPEDSVMEEASVEDEQSNESADSKESIDSKESTDSLEEDADEDGADANSEEEDAEQNGEEDNTDKKEKKRHFIKTEKKEDKLKEQLNELNDKVVRQMAEFDNYRKRTEKEKQAMFETGAKSVIEKLLPVVDNFERGLAALEEGAERTPFEEGVLMTYKQLMAELEKLEVKPLDAVGKEFDPNFHNAVMHVDDESLGENIVVEELQKGYTYRDSVVRHSMVKVAN